MFSPVPVILFSREGTGRVHPVQGPVWLGLVWGREGKGTLTKCPPPSPARSCLGGGMDTLTK